MNPQQNGSDDRSVEPINNPTTEPNSTKWPTYQRLDPEMEPASGYGVSADPLGESINAAPSPSLQSDQPVEAAPQESSPVAAPVAFAPAATPKRNKKPLLIALVATGAVLLLGGTAAAYQFWYQNPDKVVTDSIMKALSAKTATFTGTLDTTGQAAKLKVDFDGAATKVASTTHAKTVVSVGAVNVTLDGSLQTSQNGDMYVKLGNAKDLAGTVVQMMGGQSNPEIDAFAAKINDKWVKITPKDLSANGDDSKSNTMTCLSDTLTKVQNDAAMRRELTDLYGKDRFIMVKKSLGEKDGSLGYVLDGDNAKLKNFIIGVKKTKFYTAMQKCDSEFKLDENELTKESTSDMTGEVEVWVNKWTHQLTQVKVAGHSKDNTSSGSLVFNPVFGKPVTIATPTDALTVSQLQQDMQALTASMMSPVAN